MIRARFERWKFKSVEVEQILRCMVALSSELGSQIRRGIFGRRAARWKLDWSRKG